METFVEEDTTYKKHCAHKTLPTQSPSKQVPWDLTQFSQSSSAAPPYFPGSHRQTEISSLSKVILVFGKARRCRPPNLGCRRAESPRRFDVSPQNSAQGVMHEQTHCCDEAVNHQLPIAVTFWIIQIASAEECSSLTQNLIHLLLYLLGHFECDGHTVHMLTQLCLLPPLTSTVKSSLFTHAHSRPLSLAARLHRFHTNHSHNIHNG